MEKRIRNYSLPKYIENIQEIDKRLMKEGHSINYEQISFSDNKLHSVNISKALIKTDKDPAYMLFSGWDVTELFSGSFQTANNQLAMVMDAGEIISWVWDVESER